MFIPQDGADCTFQYNLTSVLRLLHFVNLTARANIAYLSAKTFVTCLYS